MSGESGEARDPGADSHRHWSVLMEELRMLRQDPPLMVRMRIGQFLVAVGGIDPTHVYLARMEGPREGEAGVFPLAGLEEAIGRYFNEAF
jgi:hypothetical protein